MTDEHPNPIPDAKDMKEFTTFTACNPNYCMRNIALVEKDVPDYSVAVDYEQGKLGAEIHFIVESSGCSPYAEFSLGSTNPHTAPHVCIKRKKVPADGILTGICVDVPEGYQSNFY